MNRTPFDSHYRRWIYVASTLVLLLFIVVSFAYDRQLDEWYWLTFAAPRLQKDLGFRTGTRLIKLEGGGAFNVFTITYVESGGTFDRAGFRVGDVPTEWFMHGGAPAGFYARLERSRGGGPVSFVVASPTSQSIRANERTLTVQVPP